ncbi:hypothetical protein TELCIR_18752 [Teladorsagia circumcincta]|uniref:Uncharacterized protein n=1 Tax=Teladorsagia circumcincta TaxID=45464 RepID=A0A2G9TQM9_TELCI|nr:hypothetical protein TELCIR_18752 [Teladorsagia circumcincta]
MYVYFVNIIQLDFLDMKNRYFRSIQTKEKLYVIEKPVEETNEISDDHGAAAGPSKRAPEQPSQSNDTILYKWKVKRRCDGSRYVVKRPARNQILKKRAAQLIRERTGISTDDDAMSELKLGHFHTREERKKHLEEERRRKIRNQQKLIESKISPADQMIVQLSQRKMQRRKEKNAVGRFRDHTRRKRIRLNSYKYTTEQVLWVLLKISDSEADE